MEVFTAVYDKDLVPVIEPEALVISHDRFNSLLVSNTILFSGNGSEKVKHMISHPNAFFCGRAATAADMTGLAEKRFGNEAFADLAYTEPLYIKEFYSPAR